MPDNFTAAEIAAIPYVISQPRFATYLRVQQNDIRAALALYRWNVELSAAFFMPLQICEVAIRNAAAEAIERVHGSTWPWVVGFSRTLPITRRGYDPSHDLRDVTRKHTTTGQVIAELKFAFWEFMFTVGQDGRIWNTHLRAVLPHAPAGVAIAALRKDIHDDIEKIRRFRNRIAHHEPIFARDISVEYSRILKLIEWRSPDTAAWVNKVQTVTEVLARRPRDMLDGAAFQYPVR